MALTVAKRTVARETSPARPRPPVRGRRRPAWWIPRRVGGVRPQSRRRVWLPVRRRTLRGGQGDAAVLDEGRPFIEGPTLATGQGESYFQATVSPARDTLFEHCARALDGSLGVGGHGLPLIGTGDWNDGMNRVGREGRGESVWLGWFLQTALGPFARIADARGEHARAAAWRDHGHALQTALEEHAWDGDCYRRAYFDDGTPLGSVVNAACRIDSSPSPGG